MAADFEIPEEKLCRAAAIPQRTWARRKKEDRLQPDESDRVLRRARVFAHAVEVFEYRRRAARWLVEPVLVLGRRSPLSLLDTDLGALEVEAATLDPGTFVSFRVEVPEGVSLERVEADELPAGWRNHPLQPSSPGK